MTSMAGKTRKRGASYVVDDDWRKRVEARLAELKWSRADLHRESGVLKSTISNLLNGRAHECVDLDKIHKALKWPPPLPPILPPEASELINLWDAMSEMARGRALERVRAIYEQDILKKP